MYIYKKEITLKYKSSRSGKTCKYFQRAKYCWGVLSPYIQTHLVTKRTVNPFKVIKRLPWSLEPALLVDDKAPTLVPMVLNDYLEAPERSDLGPERPHCSPATLLFPNPLLPCRWWWWTPQREQWRCRQQHQGLFNLWDDLINHLNVLLRHDVNDSIFIIHY